jgi:hypothetical protein
VVAHTTSNGSVTSCSIDGGGALGANVWYCFLVTASNSYGAGVLSPLSLFVNVSNVTQGVTNPAPVFLQSLSVENSGVSLSWSTPSSDGGIPISMYQVVVTDVVTNAPVSVLPVLTNNNSSSVYSSNVSGLLNGVRYKLFVYAVNDDNYQSTSCPDDSSVPCDPIVTPCGVPASPVITSVVGARAAVAMDWQAPVDNGCAITSYAVSLKTLSTGKQLLYRRIRRCNMCFHSLLLMYRFGGPS